MKIFSYVCGGSLILMGSLIAMQPNEQNLNQSFIYAVYQGKSLKEIQDLFNQGANINAKEQSKGITPLMLAVDYQNLDLIKFLLDHKADMFIQDNVNQEALDYLYTNLSGRKWDQIIAQFLDHGFPINRIRKGFTLLANAERRADCASVKLLLQRGANPFLKDTKNKDSQSAIEIALANKHCLNEFQPYQAIQDAKKGIIATKEFVKKQPQFVNIITDEKGETLLHHAVLSGDIAWVVYLLSMGADPTIKNNKGETAVDLARASGPRMLNLFVKAAEGGKVAKKDATGASK